MNKLTIIATPIGNLNDVSPNMINTICQLDYIFCEDTRVTNKFLKLINITKNIKLISYNKFNEFNKLDEVVGLIEKFECGLMSDAGYPSLSDPGYLLVSTCHNRNIRVDVIDGPCAINHAIVQSGMCSNGFTFIGFLAKKENEIIDQLCNLLTNDLPIICFESVHRINLTLTLLKKRFPDIKIYVGRELSKKFETYYVGDIQEVPNQIEKGEFTLVLLNDKKNEQTLSMNDIFDKELNMLLSSNIKLKDACKYLANKYNISASKIYNNYQLKIK